MDKSKTLSDKMSGRFKQPGDAGGKRVLNGHFLRAPLPRGRITSIELPELPQGMVCVTNADSPGKIKIGSISFPLFTDKLIRWEGEPVLAAAGLDSEEVEDWISRIKIDIAPPEEVENLSATEKLLEKGSTVEAFSKAFQVVEDRIEIPQTSAPPEQQTLVCVKDGANYTIHATSSWPGNIRRNVAGILKTDKKNIHVRIYPVSTGSNQKMWFPAVTACQAALLSVNAKRSVRIRTLPGETRLYTPGTPGADFNIRGAVDSEGKIIALEIIFTIYSGAFFPLEEEFLERVILGLFSIYPCRNYSIFGRIEHGSTPPSAFGPAAGFELGFLAGELFASRVAEHSLTTPGGWHREFMPLPGQAFGPGIVLPKDFPMNAMLNKALDTSDFDRKRASYEQIRLGKNHLGSVPEFYSGIGLSCAWFGNGFLSSPKELGSASLSLTLEKDGELSIEIPSFNQGGILKKAWLSLSSSILGVDEKNISFSDPVSRVNQEPGPSILGRNVSIYTKLLELAGNDLSKRRFRDPLPISVSRSRRRSGSKTWNSDLLEGSPFDSISWGVCIVEVQISTLTMEVKPMQIWLVIDGGHLLLPDFAKAAVESSAEETLQWLHSGGTQSDLALIDIQFHNSGNKRNSKDVSTLPWLLIPAAYMQAVRQASGIEINKIPVSPELLGYGGMK